MIFTETPLAGAFLIDPEMHQDERGFFARTWCKDEYARHGINTSIVQCNISFNIAKDTLRGMHYQKSPYEEAKLVRCTMGAIFDVIVDLRFNSPTYAHWFSTELTAENRRLLYIPQGIAHGFLTLVDKTEVFYQMSEFYHAESAFGVRWNDPAFGIRWPTEPRLISDKDEHYPDFNT